MNSGLLSGNLNANVNVVFDRQSTLWLLSMVFILILLSSVAVKLVSKF